MRSNVGNVVVNTLLLLKVRIECQDLRTTLVGCLVRPPLLRKARPVQPV